MANARRYTAALIAIVGSLGMAAPSGIAAQSSQNPAGQSSETSSVQNPASASVPITDGSKVTLLYQIKVPGDERIEVRDLSQFVQGQHQMLPALERAVTG